MPNFRGKPMLLCRKLYGMYICAPQKAKFKKKKSRQSFDVDKNAGKKEKNVLMKTKRINVQDWWRSIP